MPWHVGILVILLAHVGATLSVDRYLSLGHVVVRVSDPNAAERVAGMIDAHRGIGQRSWSAVMSGL